PPELRKNLGGTVAVAALDASRADGILQGAALHLNSAKDTRLYHCLTYANYLLDDKKWAPLLDEYAYNGTNPVPVATVHDFVLTCEIEATEGAGWVGFALTDGQDEAVVEIPVGAVANGDKARLTVLPADAGPNKRDQRPALASASRGQVRA